MWRGRGYAEIENRGLRGKISNQNHLQTFLQKFQIAHRMNEFLFSILGHGCDPGGEVLKPHKKVIM